MLLKTLLEGTVTTGEYPECDICDIVYDSRKAREDTVFVCIKGETTDGHKYAKSAYDLGCRVFLAQSKLDLPEDATVIMSTDTRRDLAQMSTNFFRHPAKELKVIGITGTKGKTSITYILRSALENCGIKTGVIGTIGAFYDDKKLPTVNTTPESYELQRILREMADGGCEAVCMEVSSIGLKMSRVYGIEFYAGIFTNLSPDHIGGNEHKSFEEYAYWKKQLYAHSEFTVANRDDAFFDDISASSKGEVISYGLDEKCDYYAENVNPLRRSGFLGIEFDCCKKNGEKWHAQVSMPGFFSVYNVLAAVAVLEKMGVPTAKMQEAFMRVSIDGRMQIVPVSGDYSVIIDYAHNGLSMENVIETVRAYEPNRVVALFGSTGGKATIRRRELGLVSAKMCDSIIITSDDPEYEDPDAIIDEIADWIEQGGGAGKYVKITDRAEAINYALDHMQKGDILLLLGKGHEHYMKIKGEKVPFSEIECIERYIKTHSNN